MGLITDAGLAATSSAEGGSEGAKSDPPTLFFKRDKQVKRLWVSPQHRSADLIRGHPATQTTKLS